MIEARGRASAWRRAREPRRAKLVGKAQFHSSQRRSSRAAPRPARDRRVSRRGASPRRTTARFAARWTRRSAWSLATRSPRVHSHSQGRRAVHEGERRLDVNKGHADGVARVRGVFGPDAASKQGCSRARASVRAAAPVQLAACRLSYCKHVLKKKTNGSPTTAHEKPGRRQVTFALPRRSPNGRRTGRLIDAATILRLSLPAKTPARATHLESTGSSDRGERGPSPPGPGRATATSLV